MTYKLHTRTVLAVLLLAAAGCNQRPATKENLASGSLTIAYSRLRISLPIFVAQEKGLFAAHGLQVQLQGYVTAQPMMQALAEGKLNVAGYTALPITFNAIERSNNPLVFTTLMLEDPQHRISYLLRRKTAPHAKPTIGTIADLRGKKIGILPTIAYKSWLNLILKANGIDPERDVIIQPVAPELEASALKGGGVDALFTNDPMATAALATGVAELISNDVACPKYIENPLPFGSFNVRKAWADGNRETLQKIVASLDDAIAFINSHPDQAKQMMAPYIGDQFKDQVSLYPDAKYLSSKDAGEGWFTNEAALETRLGIIPHSLDLKGLIVTGGQ